jgi:hypothetical protein
MTLDSSEPIKGLYTKIEKMYRIADEDEDKEKVLPKFVTGDKV